MDQIQLKAYAKINLGLDVLRKREDGYHELRMIMQTVKIFDNITLTKIPEDEIILNSNLKFMSNGENNLVYKAIKLLKDEFNLKGGVQAELGKYIPIAAGMAGGSTDCAATLYGMNRMYRLGLSQKQLMERGVKLGADVPYCIMRGTALSEGIGEVLTPLAPMPKCNILIAKPPISVSTKYVYENLKVNQLEEHPDIDGIVNALNSGDLKGITDRMGNVLETVTIDQYPVISEIKELMIKEGAMNALMSGSGPTVFGIFNNKELAHKAADIIRRKDLARQVYVLEPYNNYPKDEGAYSKRKNNKKLQTKFQKRLSK